MQRLFTIGSFLVLSLTVACGGSSGTGPFDSSPASLALDADTRRDAGAEDVASGSDARDAIRVLGDARTLPPDSRKCRPEWADSSSCECIRITPSPEDIPECSAASVLSSPLETGLCCEDSFGCTCFAYGCTSSTSAGICECGQAGASGLPADGVAVLECPSLSSEQKCCMYAFAHTCICSSSACTSDGEEVPTCTVAGVAACDSGAAVWTTCK